MKQEQVAYKRTRYKSWKLKNITTKIPIKNMVDEVNSRMTQSKKELVGAPGWLSH